MFLYMVEENQSLCPANYSAYAGEVERVQHYTCVDTSKRLEPGVAGNPFVVWIGL